MNFLKFIHSFHYPTKTPIYIFVGKENSKVWEMFMVKRVVHPMWPRRFQYLLMRYYNVLPQDSKGHIYLEHDPSYSFTKINDHSPSIFLNSIRTSLQTFLECRTAIADIQREKVESHDNWWSRSIRIPSELMKQSRLI